ncbi:hypothetical protein JR316_0003423 [Psilocybe cubensis]|uniref:Uncharacterized protein n=2 Tax=Psilocybe cubensis TaxID=181762 RepID=A0ACB8H8A8_PSICU|nr:hypothetical protein JR316_0003423 [Psilocybe cubensis]KAH9483945.1 hypothetical protein JR316_0003423 [Psilocybe cubensis]
MAQYPPSTRISDPVMNLEASLARKTIAPCKGKEMNRRETWLQKVHTDKSSGSPNLVKRSAQCITLICQNKILTRPIGVSLSQVA